MAANISFAFAKHVQEILTEIITAQFSIAICEYWSVANEICPVANNVVLTFRRKQNCSGNSTAPFDSLRDKGLRPTLSHTKRPSSRIEKLALSH
jgi:hypothetical protein